VEVKTTSEIPPLNFSFTQFYKQLMRGSLTGAVTS